MGNTSAERRTGVAGGRGHLEQVSMPADWTRDKRLSLAAIGFLAKLTDLLSGAPRGTRVRLDELAGNGESAGLVVDELRRCGYLIAGQLVDPFASAREATLHSEHPEYFARRYRPSASRPAVYYLQRAVDGAVKIGHTKDLRERVKSLSREYGSVALLAAEPGGCDVETRRHAQFSELRLPAERRPGGTEWFRLDAPLSQHVERLGGRA